jgi:hypothetical protein
MTRRNLKRKLTYTFAFLGVVLLLAAVARFSYPLQDNGSLAYIAWLATYDYLKDMSLLIATGGVAYLTNVYQKRSSFIDSLKEEWRDVLHAKSALLEFTHLEQPSTQQYVTTFNVLSETIDNMRTVYRNVGETRELVGLYPFAPLHDMRRVLQTLNPAKAKTVSEDQRKQVRDAILQAFYALREVFLEELDLEEPSRPLLIVGGRRVKRSGAPRWAQTWQDRQAKRHSKVATPDAMIDALHKELYDKEQATPKPWRDVATNADARTGA